MTAHEQAARAPFVELRGIGKRYGGIQALAGIDLEIGAASVHALVGENGAGKSTLGKIVGGVIAPDEGTLSIGGRPVSYSAPREALKDGITVISQEVTLVPERSVIENVFLGQEVRTLGWVRRGELARRYDELVDRAGFHLPPDAQVSSFRIADQQKVEILRAIARNARLIVMDEPTAALSPNETATLFEIIRRLNAGGTSIVYVSHFLEEVLEISDTVSVLKDGRHVRTAPADRETPDSLIMAMLGKPLAQAFPPKTLPPADARVVLEVEGLGHGDAVRDVSFQVRAGEIVGMAGLVGAGRSETARLIFGADRAERGTIRLDGRAVRVHSPHQAVRLGIGMLPESRKEQGLVLGRSLTENVSLAHLGDVAYGRVVLAGGREKARTDDVLARVDARGAAPDAPVGSLSGGNQQKVLFGRWLFDPPRVLIADEPTRGVDVGAKAAIYELLTGLAQSGMAIIVISSELEEVLGLAHRVLVMRSGSVVAELGQDTTEADVLQAAFGASAAGSATASL